jgi:hypothetical protein
MNPSFKLRTNFGGFFLPLSYWTSVQYLLGDAPGSAPATK